MTGRSPSDRSAGSPIRVLQLIATTRRRGAELFAVDLETALQRRGFAVSTLALQGTDGEVALPVTALGGRRWSISSLRQLRTRIAEADLIIAHGSSSLPAVVLASWGSGVPFIYRLIGDPAYWAPGWTRRARVRAMLHRARYVAVYFPAAATSVVARYRIPPDRVIVIPKGLAISRYPEELPEDRERARTAIGLDPDDHRHVVALVGALTDEKRPGLAVEAIRRMPEAILVLAGEGHLRSSLERSLPAHDDQIRFLGAVEDPRPVYRAADVVLLTSATEGIPGVVVEAAACGRPVVATDVGGISTVVEDGTTGYLVADTPEDIVGGLRRALAAADELGAAARDRACRELDLEPIVDRWATLIEEALSSR